MAIPHNTHPGVLMYNGKAYAVGLLWFTVQEETAKEMLRQRLKKTGADFYCLRQHISQQQGFGFLDKGHRRSMPAAAAMVADQLVGEWHGVFEADNGWWYLQVRSDTLTPTGDRFFTSEEDAFNMFQEEMTKHNWPHAYAPDKWRLADRGIRELPLKNLLDDLVTTSLTPANLTALFGSATSRNAVLGGLAAVFIAMAGIAIYSSTSEPDMPPPVRVAPVRPVLTIKKEKALELVAPQQLAQECAKAADKLFQSLPGWKMDKFVCADGKATLSWQQVTGSLNEAKKYGAALWPPTVAVSFANRMLIVNLGMDKLPTIEVENLPPQDAALLYLEQNLQPLGMLQVQPVTPPAPPAPPQSSSFMGGGSPPPPPPPAPPSYLDITFRSGFGPEKIAPLLSQPGVELIQTEWTIGQAMWQYKIKWTYDKPKPAAPAVTTPIRPNTATAAPQNNALNNTGGAR